MSKPFIRVIMAHFGEAGCCAPLSENTSRPVVAEGSDSAEILSVNRGRRLIFVEAFNVRNVDGSKECSQAKRGSWSFEIH